MRRRDFLTVLSGAAAWPLAARAQQPAVPVIGFLHSGSPEANVSRVAAFRKGLGETGYVEGQNVAIEFHWAAEQDDRLPELAADLLRRRVAVIATPASTQGALAAKAATATIPIVFAIGADPVALGLITALNRPGGNVTGISFQTVELVAKRLELLRELAPKAARFAALVNPDDPFTDAVVKDLQASAPLPVEFLYARTGREIDTAFVTLAQRLDGALLVSPDTLFFQRRAEIVTLAARYELPAIYSVREYSDIGGLMSYGPNIEDACRQAGVYAGRILKGEKPADLPVQQSTKFELVINIKTAKSLGLIVPQTLLVAADEVIE